MTSPKLRLLWLVLLAFLLQWLAIYLPASRERIPDQVAAIFLVTSQVLLLVFIWSNRSSPRYLLLGIGLTMNLVVIIMNGGLMPISPKAVMAIAPDAPAGSWQTGSRLGWGKDVVLTTVETNLWILSDHLLFQRWFPYRVAFSIGDIFLACGAFLALWASGDDDFSAKE